MSPNVNAAILAPLTITPGMIAAGTTVPVVDTSVGEVAWAAATDYAVGQRVNHDGAIWEAVVASKGVTPGTDAKKWLRAGPSNRMAPFDDALHTRAVGKGVMTFVIDAGFASGLALYKLTGSAAQVEQLDGPGGAVVQQWERELYEQALGLFEYLFMPLRPLTKLVLHDLPLLPQGQVRITLTSPNNGEVAVGMIVLGFWRSLVGTGDFGGVEMGASAEIKTYSYIKTNDDGSTVIVPRHSATNLSCTVAIDANEANAAAELLAEVAAKPVAFVASGLPRYDYANVFGLVSGSVKADSWRVARINLNVKGYI